MPDEETYSLMFDDLTPEAQTEFLKFMGLESAADGNYDVYPVHIFNKPESYTEG